MKSSVASSIFYLLIAMLSIHCGAAIAKNLFPLAGPAGTTSFRTLFAAIVLLAIWRPWKFSFARSSWPALIGYGVSLGLMNLCFYFSLQRIPLGIAVTLEFTGPLTVAMLSSKKPIDMLWAFLAGLGVYLILPGMHSAEALDILGIGLALAAGFFWALYIVFGQKAGDGLHSGRATAIGMCFAALATVPFGLAINPHELINLNLWPLGLAIALLSSAIPYNFEMLALKSLPRKTFGILMSLEPVLAVIVGFILLNETLTILQMLAIVCIIIASAGSAATAKQMENIVV